MQLETRTIQTGQITELYLTAIPTGSSDSQAAAEELFSDISRTLKSQDAYILQERVFGTEEALKTSRIVREKNYGDLDDGVLPSWLVVPKGANGELAGIQIHAIAGCGIPEIIEDSGLPCGRIIRTGKNSYLTLSNIRQGDAGGRNAQAQGMLEKTEAILKNRGIDFFAVPRTWMWLGNILEWYDEFNEIRNSFFRERGIISTDNGSKMPASTGIGIGPANGALCSMDLAAVIEEESSIGYLDAGGNQQSAFDYGSAFSRASRVNTPAGITVFVSGTASIGTDGKTLHAEDPQKQIETTINNVQAILREFECCDNDVVQAIAYCKRGNVEDLFVQNRSELPWPTITAIADVCREDLLFEIEATAVKKA